jgi:hypothetical protein
VAALVTSGQSNSQIAVSLVISVRTVETHVQHIMDKLGCGTRAQIAAWSAARPPRGSTPRKYPAPKSWSTHAKSWSTPRQKISTPIRDFPDAPRRAGCHRR